MVGHRSLEPVMMVRIHLLQPDFEVPSRNICARVVELADTYV